MRASVEVAVQRPIFGAGHIVSEFPLTPVSKAQDSTLDEYCPRGRGYDAPGRGQMFINGGGHKIVLRTSSGKIAIRKN